MRLGIFGGSFDPPHLGHCVIAQAAVDRLRLDRLIWVPAHRSPFKDQPQSAGSRAPTPHDRLHMVAAAIAGNPHFSVSDVELQRPPPSYSVDTLEHFSTQFPGADLFFLMGSDSYAGFGRWRNPDRICALADLVIYPRGDDVLPDAATGIIPLDAPRIQISSTALRAAGSEGRSIRYLVPESVESYIRNHRLYETA